jgi:hypothetical protein
MPNGENKHRQAAKPLLPRNERIEWKRKGRFMDVTEPPYMVGPHNVEGNMDRRKRSQDTEKCLRKLGCGFKKNGSEGE